MDCGSTEPVAEPHKPQSRNQKPENQTLETREVANEIRRWWYNPEDR